MSDQEFRKYLQQALQPGDGPDRKMDEMRMEETIQSCIEIMHEQKSVQKFLKEPRTGFVRYLSDIFRFEGILIFGLQAVTLFIICVTVYTAADSPGYIAACMPLFVLAIMPAMFKCQYYGMSEMEAATRASGPQIILAKLILAGAANLLCMTVFIFFEVHLKNSYRNVGQMILYCLVPYLVCMASMLRLIRSCRKENIRICTMIVGASCLGWGMLAKAVPWLYDASAVCLWIAAFLFFTAFFIREICFIITAGKEGKMYGIIA